MRVSTALLPNATLTAAAWQTPYEGCGQGRKCCCSAISARSILQHLCNRLTKCPYLGLKYDTGARLQIGDVRSKMVAERAVHSHDGRLIVLRGCSGAENS